MIKSVVSVEKNIIFFYALSIVNYSITHRTLEKITVVVTTNSHCKSVIISGTIFYSWDYCNHIVKSTIIIVYYIFLVDIAIKNSCPLREI